MKPTIVLIFSIFSLTACTQPKLVKFSGEAQGTYYAISYYDNNGANYQHDIDSILKAFDKVASIWEPTSEINAVNANKDIRVSSMFEDIFNKSVELSKLTDGAFDFTIGPLVKAYGFWNKQREEITDEKIQNYLKLVNYHNVKIKKGRVIKTNPDIKLDFNAIAQGYSVDLLGRFFEQKGITNYLIDIGGEVLGKGQKPNGDHWRVGVEKPSATADDGREVETVVELIDGALVSSGNYRKYYEKDGKRYSHTLDPKTGKPVQHTLLSVTVKDTAAWRADALATAMMVLGVEKSFDLLEKLPGVEAYFISSADEGFWIVKSKGF